MDERTRTYTLDEIEELTGFDKRTIAYYVQEDVLPKVGRRGPRTRYPQLFLDRLLFIKRVRELQDAGRLGTMTLGDFRDVFEQLSSHEIADLAAGHKPIEPVAHGAYEPRLASPSMSSVRRRVELLSALPHVASSRRDEPLPPVLDALEMPRFSGPVAEPKGRSLWSRVGELLGGLQRSIGPDAADRSAPSERWVRAHVTENITVSVRDLDEHAVDRLEELVKILRSSMPEDEDT